MGYEKLRSPIIMLRVGYGTVCYASVWYAALRYANGILRYAVLGACSATRSALPCSRGVGGMGEGELGEPPGAGGNALRI